MMLHVSISLLFCSITDRLEIVHIVNGFAWYNDLPQGQFKKFDSGKRLPSCTIKSSTPTPPPPPAPISRSNALFKTPRRLWFPLPSPAHKNCYTYNVESLRHPDHHPDHNPTSQNCDNESYTCRSTTPTEYRSRSFQSTQVWVGWSSLRKTSTSCCVQIRSRCNSTWCILFHW